MKIPQGFVVDAEIKGPYGDYMTLSRKGNGYVTHAPGIARKMVAQDRLCRCDYHIVGKNIIH